MEIGKTVNPKPSPNHLRSPTRTPHSLSPRPTSSCSRAQSAHARHTTPAWASPASAHPARGPALAALRHAPRSARSRPRLLPPRCTPGPTGQGHLLPFSVPRPPLTPERPRRDSRARSAPHAEHPRALAFLNAPARTSCTSSPHSRCRL